MGNVDGGWKTLPGETPIEDISGLRIAGIRSRADLNRHEAENIRKAFVKYLAGKPTRRSARFDLEWLFELHGEMFGDVWDWAGACRKTEKNIGVLPAQIEIQLHGLVEDLKHWEQGELDLLQQAALLHHRAVMIHPFDNGNGRWARLLANIWLKMHDHSPTEWPEETVGTVSTIRDEYLDAIRSADHGDLSPLEELHRRHTPNDE